MKKYFIDRGGIGINKLVITYRDLWTNVFGLEIMWSNKMIFTIGFKEKIQ